MNETQEAALIHRCQTGDKEAFRMLVDQYRSALFGTAYLMARDRGLAEDAVQEALIQIWKHLPSLRIRSSIKAWMVRIVVNELNQQFRKKQLPTVPLEMAEVRGEPDEAEPGIIRKEEYQSIKQALDKLPSEQREIVILHYFSELTVPEIAAAVNQREGTIKSRLSRALDRLGEILRHNEMWEVKG